jgi:hypothetical protein
VTDKRISNRPIEIGEVEAFQVYIEPTRMSDPLGQHRFRAKKAINVRDEDVAPADLDALRWLRAKRGLLEDGAPYVMQRYSQALGVPYRDEIPQRAVTVEIQVFQAGSSDRLVGHGLTLSLAVHDAQVKLTALGPGFRTYPEFDAGLDRVLLKVGEADFRVADLLALIRDYYDDDHSTGGALHCVLDDGNMGDGHIHSFDPNDKAAVLIAELLKLVPEAERFRLYERGYGR